MPVRKILDYYSSLQGALQGIVNAEARKYTAEGEKSLETALTELAAALGKLKEEITGAVPTAEAFIHSGTEKGAKT